MSVPIEQEYLVLEQTILSFDAIAKGLVIPDRLQNQPVRAIGKGAFAEAPALQWARLPSGLLRIGDSAFKNCAQLERLELEGVLPEFGEHAFAGCVKLRALEMNRLPVKPSEYRALKENSCAFPDGLLVSSRFPSFSGLDRLPAALDVETAAHIPKSAGTLFASPSPEQGLYVSPEELRCFMVLVRNERETFFSPEAEAANDLFARRDKSPGIRKTAVFCFDDRQSLQTEQQVLLKAKVCLGYYFWLARVPVLCDGTVYSLCLRHYLSPDSGMEYVRREMGIYTPEGKLRDERRAKEVYAKYKLLTIL